MLNPTNATPEAICRFRAKLPLKNALPTQVSSEALIPSLANSLFDSIEVKSSATCNVFRLRLEPLSFLASLIFALFVALFVVFSLFSVLFALDFVVVFIFYPFLSLSIFLNFLALPFATLQSSTTQPMRARGISGIFSPYLFLTVMPRKAFSSSPIVVPLCKNAV